MTRTLRTLLFTAAAAALLAATDAAAQTFDVTAHVVKNCVIDAAADIAITTALAPWDPTTNANPTETGTITVRCTRGTTYTVDVNGGTYTDAMSHDTVAGETLPYKFYADDCLTDFSAITFTATSRAARNHLVCAGLDLTNAALDPIAGSYTDTVAVDITF